MFRCFQKFGIKAESFYFIQEHFGTFDVIQKLNAKAKRGRQFTQPKRGSKLRGNETKARKDKMYTKNQDFGKRRKTGGNATFGNER
jgi:hypothetical protein